MDARLFDLLPHRPPMLLLDRLADVGNTFASAEVDISPSASFYQPDHGVPSWIAIEYMGQTAALIAGYQLQQGTVAPHQGLLLGSRKFHAFVPYFNEQTTLLVRCSELAVVGENLATFDCEVTDNHEGSLVAKAKLSVFRKVLE